MSDKALKKKLQQLHIPQYDEYKLEKVIVEAKKNRFVFRKSKNDKY